MDYDFKASLKWDNDSFNETIKRIRKNENKCLECGEQLNDKIIREIKEIIKNDSR